MKAATFKEDYIAIIARELLKGLEYLHGEGKLHRGKPVSSGIRLIRGHGVVRDFHLHAGKKNTEQLYFLSFFSARHLPL